jgi:hypothetical protein
MNQIEQVETHLNAVLNIDDIRTNMITIEDNMLIIDLNYYSETALVNLYNRAAGGYLSIRPEISAGQLSYALVPEKAKKPVEAFAYPE